MARGRPARLGHQPRRALLRLPHPRRPRQVLLRLARCPHRLPGQLQGPLRAHRHRLRRLHRRRPQRRCRNRNASLPGQGHHQLPRPVLAGDAARRRPARADQAARQRLPHRERREDEQVARHLRHGAHLPGHRAQPRIPALLLRQQDRRRRGGPRPQPRGLRGAREQRPGGQVRQHRQPGVGLRHQALRWKARPAPRQRRPRRQRRRCPDELRRHPRGLPGRRNRSRDPGSDATVRPPQPALGRSQTLAAREGPRQGRRAAARVQRVPARVLPGRGLPGADHARPLRPRPEAVRPLRHRPGTAGAGPADIHPSLRTPDDPH